MNEQQKQLARAASDLGLKVEIGFALTLSEGRVVVSQALFPELGNPHGTLVFCTDQDIGAAQRREIRELGYGMSTFGKPSPKVAYDSSSYAEMFAEWGWMGAPENKPAWMIALGEATDPLPPLAIDDAHVLAYLQVDQSITFTGKLRLFAGRQLLGRVPNLAIAVRHEVRELLVFHCDEKWEVVAVQAWNGPAGAHIKTLDDVKRAMEEYYEGSLLRWQQQASVRDLGSLIWDGRIDELKAIIAADPRLANATDEFGTTLLIEAARYGARDLVKELLAHGADASHLDGMGTTPLHAALEARIEQRGDFAGVLDDLLQHDADADRIGYSGYSPLHFAVSHGMLTEVRRMLEQGADPNLRTDEYDLQTPLMMAAKSSNRELLELLRKHGAKY